MFRDHALAIADRNGGEAKEIIRLLVVIVDGYDAIDRVTDPAGLGSSAPPDRRVQDGAKFD